MHHFNLRFVYCTECGSEVFPGASFCQSCGCRLSPKYQAGVSRKGNLKDDSWAQSTRSLCVVRSPGLAAVLSFILPGLGEIYAGKIFAGFLVMSIEIFLLCVAAHVPVAVFLCVTVWIYSINNAYKRSMKWYGR